MSKVRTVAAIGVAVGVAVVGSIAITTHEFALEEVSNDYIENCNKLSDNQKIFLKVMYFAGSLASVGSSAAFLGAEAGKWISKTILKA